MIDSQPNGSDSLTGVYNTRSFLETLKRETEKAELELQPLTLLMIDIDSLQAVNDREGYGVGDEVLRKLARIVQLSADLVFRCAGDEFAVILSADLEAGWRIAEDIRSHVESTTLKLVNGFEGRVTVSIGIAEFERGLAAERLIQRADQASYQAKRGGKNRVAAYGRPPDDAPTVWQPIAR